MSPIVIEIAGEPVAKGRARIGLLKTKEGPRPVAFTPASTRKWEADARVLARQAMKGREPLPGPITLRYEARFRPPDSWPEWRRDAALRGDIEHCGSRDLDNLLKTAKDALNKIVWVDDAQVVEIEARKRFAAAPGVRIEVVPRSTASSRITRKDQLPQGVK